MSKKSKRIKDLLFKAFVVLLTVLIIISILLTMLIMFLRYGFPDYQSTDINAINCSYSMRIDSKDDILFKYENSKSELCIYSNHNDDFCVAFLNKINLFGKTFYNNKISTNKFYTTFGKEYLKAGKDLYYIFLENNRRIADIDSCGYTPEEHYISYTDGSDEIHYGYIYVIDTENNHTSNQEFTNYSHSTGKFY